MCVSTMDLCSDQMKNGDETDVDCGGSCAACADGGVCAMGSDCLSGVCDLLDSRTCEPANQCGNGVPEAGEACEDGNVLRRRWL